MALKLYTHALQTLAGASAQTLSSTDLWVSSVTLVTNSANSGTMYLGSSTVATTTGVPIPAGASVTLDASMIRGTSDEFNLADLYIIGTATDTVRLSTVRSR
jgi:hypothetical protein